ncbi:hypothetical protein [Streptomyces sp. NBC_01618]|uniref:hypothetical protein n=1 Tax=Streptomyces sp. NBC_01618 TaxID=2975900 RepID=UPI00386E6D9C|nr:hypothetical protein OH735_22165 [Streptomyces sp. NBC_01618]
MHRYKLTFLLVFVPSMLGSGISRIKDSGWSLIWGVLEVALGVAISVGAIGEIREGLKRRREEGERKAGP